MVLLNKKEVRRVIENSIRPWPTETHEAYRRRVDEMTGMHLVLNYIVVVFGLCLFVVLLCMLFIVVLR